MIPNNHYSTKQTYRVPLVETLPAEFSQMLCSSDISGSTDPFEFDQPLDADSDLVF